MNRLIEVQDLSGDRFARHVYDTDNERVMKVDYNPAEGVTSAASTYWRDEAGQVQFEGTEQRGPDPGNAGSQFSSTSYKAYGYALGKIAYEVSFSQNLNSGGCGPLAVAMCRAWAKLPYHPIHGYDAGAH